MNSSFVNRAGLISVHALDGTNKDMVHQLDLATLQHLFH